MDAAGETEQLIVRWNDGERDARDNVISRILPELEKIAAARLRKEENSSLSSADLINEAVEKLLKQEAPQLESRAHVLALCSRLMRNVLVDKARARRSGKRSHQRVELNTRIEGIVQIDLFSLESALIRLGAIDRELMELVEMRYFGGMTIADIGEVTGWSEATTKRRWRVARAWLANAIDAPIDND